MVHEQQLAIAYSEQNDITTSHHTAKVRERQALVGTLHHAESEMEHLLRLQTVRTHVQDAIAAIKIEQATAIDEDGTEEDINPENR
jgi:hypothetical protein